MSKPARLPAFACLLTALALIAMGCGHPPDPAQFPFNFPARMVDRPAMTNHSYSMPLVERLEARLPGESEQTFHIVEYAAGVLMGNYCRENPSAPCCTNKTHWPECLDKPFETKDIAIRDAHAKHHGCVEAVFESRRQLPGHLAKGVFAPGSRYPAWIRFSNGRPAIQADSEKDARGIAIKLMDVPGKKLLADLVPEDEQHTQDFIGANYPRFFIPDIETYGAFGRATDTGNLVTSGWFFMRHPSLFLILNRTIGQVTYSPLETTYHSMTPYLLGTRSDGVAVKYQFEPVHCDSDEPVEPHKRSRKPFNYLQEAMAERLRDGPNAQPVCIDFSVVERLRDPSDPATQSCRELPVENAACEWKPKKSRRTSVARLVIPPQSFESEEQMAFCENLSFTPWHALPHHQPIGGLNRLRRSVYTAISNLRHALNHQEKREPTAEPLVPGRTKGGDSNP